MGINKFETPEPASTPNSTAEDNEFPNAKKIAWDEDMPVSMLITALQKLADYYGPDTPVEGYLGDPRDGGGGVPLVVMAVGPVVRRSDGSNRIIVAVAPDVDSILSGL